MPILAVLATIACAAAIVRGRNRRQALPLLGAFLLFSLLRLPTGNIWDAVIDPLLWGWAVAALAADGLRRLRRRPLAGDTQREPAPGLAADLPALGTAGIDTYSPNKEH